MIRITFIFRDKIITWFIDGTGIFFITFCITNFCLVINYLLSPKKVDVSVRTIRGGSNDDISVEGLAKCIQKDGNYEIVNPTLKKFIRQILKIKNSNQLIVIDRIVLLVASIVMNKLHNKMRIMGPAILVEQVQAIVGKALAGVGIPLIIWHFVSSILTNNIAIVVAIAINAAVLVGFNSHSNSVHLYEVCKEHVRMLEHIDENKEIQYIDLPKKKSDLIVLKTDENKELYVSEKLIKESCQIESLDGQAVPIGKKGEIKRKCSSEKNYVPLKERTKTLADIKKSDETEHLEKVQELVVSDKEKQALSERLKN